MEVAAVKQISEIDEQEVSRKSLYKIGGVAALATVLVGMVEIGITFMPGGNVVCETVFDWFTLFQNNSFMALRNVGLLNIFFNALAIPIFLALYGVHHRNGRMLAMLAMIISFIGVAVFYATNRAFAMFDLSQQYVLATTEAQKSMLAAAGQAMLSVGKSHTPGTFIAFFLSEAAGVLVSIAMLRGKLFSSLNAYAGILGFGFLLIFEIATSFVPTLQSVAMIFAMLGGILSMVWDILLARKFFQLAR